MTYIDQPIETPNGQVRAVYTIPQPQHKPWKTVLLVLFIIGWGVFSWFTGFIMSFITMEHSMAKDQVPSPPGVNCYRQRNI